MTMPLALLPPMPLLPRLVVGVVAAILAGILNLVFCRARWRWSQLVAAVFAAPIVVYLVSWLGLKSGQRTGYALVGAIVGILIVRGAPPSRPIPSFRTRAVVLFAAVVVLGPAIGLAFHCLRCSTGWVVLDDFSEIRLSLQDGIIASVAGTVLAVLMIVLAKRLASEPGTLSKVAESGTQQNAVGDTG